MTDGETDVRREGVVVGGRERLTKGERGMRRAGGTDGETNGLRVGRTETRTDGRSDGWKER